MIKVDEAWEKKRLLSKGNRVTFIQTSSCSNALSLFSVCCFTFTVCCFTFYCMLFYSLLRVVLLFTASCFTLHSVLFHSMLGVVSHENWKLLELFCINYKVAWQPRNDLWMETVQTVGRIIVQVVGRTVVLVVNVRAGFQCIVKPLVSLRRFFSGRCSVSLQEVYP